MTQVEQLRIFLASPTDVNTERRHVERVVEEINRTVAPPLGVNLQVISSKNAFPGYGQDGQAILNEQIGQMKDYDLFIGIMWNRIGTATPRAKSGTLEEFTRAVKSWMRRKKPEVWFYFRQAAAHLTTKEELRQRDEVLTFRAQFRNGLFRDYTSPSNFQEQLREHLTLWLNQRQGDKLKSRTRSTRKAATPKNQVNPAASAASRTQRTSQMRGARTKTSEADAPAKSSKSSQKVANQRRKAAQTVEGTRSPKDWVMLGEHFFQVKSSVTQPDKSTIIQIPSKNSEQNAALGALQAKEVYRRPQIAFANSHDAGIVQINSVAIESAGERTIFNIALSPATRAQRRNLLIEATINNYTADQIAELRARQILLGEALPTEISRLFSVNLINSNNRSIDIEKGIFQELWTRLQTQPSQFLPKAWLWATYHLKTSQVIEDILELELGPIKQNTMPIQFRGRREKVYSNQEPYIVNVSGSYTFSA